MSDAERPATGAAHVRWARGGEAAVVSAEDDRVAVGATVRWAPGSGIGGALPSGSGVRLKVARCRGEGEAVRIGGKQLDATRAVRDEVARLCAGDGDSQAR